MYILRAFLGACVCLYRHASNRIAVFICGLCTWINECFHYSGICFGERECIYFLPISKSPVIIRYPFQECWTDPIFSLV